MQWNATADSCPILWARHWFSQGYDEAIQNFIKMGQFTDVPRTPFPGQFDFSNGAGNEAGCTHTQITGLVPWFPKLIVLYGRGSVGQLCFMLLGVYIVMFITAYYCPLLYQLHGQLASYPGSTLGVVDCDSGRKTCDLKLQPCVMFQEECPSQRYPPLNKFCCILGHLYETVLLTTQQANIRHGRHNSNKKYCGVTPIQFGCFYFRVPSLHSCFCLENSFSDLNDTESPVNHKTLAILPTMQTSCMIIVGMMRLYTNMISGILISIILLLFSVSIVAYMHVKFSTMVSRQSRSST